MPFFSFLINNSNDLLSEFNIKPNIVYFSKSTYIWKKINKKNNEKHLNFKREKRNKALILANTILFCLPPSIGIGDAVEYAQSIKAIKDSKIFDKIGIAFCENYSFIFRDYFNLENLYPHVISKEILQKYQSIFHFTLEIKALQNQKNIRSNIDTEIKKFFKIKSNSLILNKFNNIKKKNTISIFPISNSPLRTMPINILNNLINFLNKYFLVEVYFDKSSEISNYLLERTNKKNIKIKDPISKVELVDEIKKIEYGIFMDSGPLHIAKLFNKKGILIESSVSSKILLNDYNKIISIKNNFTSKYCRSPCGLTDLFNHNGNSGCYNSLRTTLSKNKKNNSIYYLERRGIKNNYLSHIKAPVGCLRTLNVQNILNYIIKDLSL